MIVNSFWLDEADDIFGTQTNATTTTTNVPFYSTTTTATSTWAQADQMARLYRIQSAWHSQLANQAQQERITRTLNTQLAANERSGWINVGETSQTVFIQWQTMYGHHLADTVERTRARAALARQDEGHRQRAAESAIERATGLLLQHLTAEQRASYLRSKFFMVSGKSGRRYRIREGHSANVDLILPDGRIEARLCAVLYDVPLPDQLLAQKLHIEMAEDEFLRVAIKHQPAIGMERIAA